MIGQAYDKLKANQSHKIIDHNAGGGVRGASGGTPKPKPAKIDDTLNPKWASLFGRSRSQGGLNQDALVFDVLYCYLSLKTCIQSLKLKFESSVVCRINDQHPSLSSFSVRPCRIYVLR